MATSNPNPNENPEIEIDNARLNLGIPNEKFDTLSNTAKELNEDVEGTKSDVKTLNKDLKEAKGFLDEARSCLDRASGETAITPSQQRKLEAIAQAAMKLREEMDRQEEVERQAAGVLGLGPEGPSPRQQGGSNAEHERKRQKQDHLQSPQKVGSEPLQSSYDQSSPPPTPLGGRPLPRRGVLHSSGPPYELDATDNEIKKGPSNSG